MRSEARRRNRIACNDRCLLVFNGENYPCIVENISISGVLVQYESANQPPVYPGDKCSLMLSHDPKGCLAYPAKVARVDVPKVALQFFDFEF